MARSEEQDEPDGGDPIAVRKQLGARLRQLREQQGLTRAQAAEPIRASESKISRMELGQVRLKERDVADLLIRYQAAEPERATLLARARHANQRSWWQPYHDVVPPWLRTYLGLESAATLIKTYEMRFVPDLLQTEEYARAALRLTEPNASPEEVERLVRLRLHRQRAVLDRPDPPQLWAVIDEAALRRPVSGIEVTRDQVEALAGIVAKAPHVRLQVIPQAAIRHAPAGGSFTILRFPDGQLPDAVYVEQLTGALRVDRPREVERYVDSMGRLCTDARQPSQTYAALTRILTDLDAVGS